MKLPKDNKEKVKVILLVAIGAAAGIYGIIVGVVKPYQNEKNAKIELIGDLSEKINRANKEIAFMTRDRRENRKLVESILNAACTNQHVLPDRLGNFLLSATDKIEAQAKACAVTIDSVRELGQAEVPRATGESTFKAYTAHVETDTDFHALIRVLAALEVGNPRLSISGVTIAVQPDVPLRHRITFDVQWPIWKDTAVLDEITRQLAEAREAARIAAESFADVDSDEQAPEPEPEPEPEHDTTPVPAEADTGEDETDTESEPSDDVAAATNDVAKAEPAVKDTNRSEAGGPGSEAMPVPAPAPPPTEPVQPPTEAESSDDQ